MEVSANPPAAVGRDRRGRTRNIFFSSLSSGTMGSAAVGLLFMAVDSVRGDPFLTPSLMGSVVFLGVSPSDVTSVRVDMMALYTVVHVTAFVMFGAAFTILYRRFDNRFQHPVALGVAIFMTLNVGMFVADAVLFPGIARAIGPLWVGVANALAAAVMAWFIHAALTESDTHLPEFTTDIV